MKQKSKKGQTWSTDAVIATVIFLGIIIAAFYLLGLGAQTKTLEELKEQSEAIPERLIADDDISFIDGTEIDSSRLDDFATMSYDEIKTELGIQGDFCIYLEDEDGNIINISPTRAAVGSSKARIGTFYCT